MPKVDQFLRKVLKIMAKTAICLLTFFILLILLICVLTLERKYSYKITDVYMQRIYIDNDSALANKKLYLVGAKTQKDKYEQKIGFMISWALYYPQSSDSICDVSIENAQGTRINNKFVLTPDTTIGSNGYTNVSDGFLLTNGNDTLWAHGNEKEVGFRKIESFRTRKIQPNTKVLIALEDTTELPETIKVIFHDREMKRTINNSPVHYKHIKPESDDWPTNWSSYEYNPAK